MRSLATIVHPCVSFKLHVLKITHQSIWQQIWASELRVILRFVQTSFHTLTLYLLWSPSGDIHEKKNIPRLGHNFMTLGNKKNSSSTYMMGCLSFYHSNVSLKHRRFRTLPHTDQSNVEYSFYSLTLHTEADSYVRLQIDRSCAYFAYGIAAVTWLNPL